MYFTTCKKPAANYVNNKERKIITNIFIFLHSRKKLQIILAR